MNNFLLQPLLVSTNYKMSCKSCRPWSDATFCGVWSGSTLFAQAYLSQYLGLIRYFDLKLYTLCQCWKTLAWLLCNIYMLCSLFYFNSWWVNPDRDYVTDVCSLFWFNSWWVNPNRDYVTDVCSLFCFNSWWVNLNRDYVTDAEACLSVRKQSVKIAKTFKQPITTIH